MSEQQEQQVSELGGALWQEGGAGAPVARGSSGGGGVGGGGGHLALILRGRATFGPTGE
jgi:hypothetical protein